MAALHHTMYIARAGVWLALNCMHQTRHLCTERLHDALRPDLMAGMRPDLMAGWPTPAGHPSPSPSPSTRNRADLSAVQLTALRCAHVCAHITCFLYWSSRRGINVRAFRRGTVNCAVLLVSTTSCDPRAFITVNLRVKLAKLVVFIVQAIV